MTAFPYTFVFLVANVNSTQRLLKLGIEIIQTTAQKRLCFSSFFVIVECMQKRLQPLRGPIVQEASSTLDNLFLNKIWLISYAPLLWVHLQGKFLQTCQLAGNWYGVTREAIENVAREGLAAVFHMDLEVSSNIHIKCNISGVWHVMSLTPSEDSDFLL